MRRDLTQAELKPLLTALVTGATGGIGLWTAHGLAARGYHVLLHGRTAAKVQHAQQWLQQTVPGAKVTPLQADLADGGQIKAMLASLRNRTESLDLLVNNAGLMAPRHVMTADGEEVTWAVNLLAPMQLTQGLLPLLQHAAARRGSARIINVGSAASDRASLNLPMLRDRARTTSHYAGLRVYGQTKLALLIHSTALAQQLAGTGVVVHCVHPGAVGTRIAAVGGWLGAFWAVASPFLLSARQGASYTLMAACDPAWANVTGCYLKRGHAVRRNPQAYDAVLAEELRHLSTAMLLDGAKQN
jgi:retinol dehydrogenase-12